MESITSYQELFTRVFTLLPPLNNLRALIILPEDTIAWKAFYTSPSAVNFLNNYDEYNIKRQFKKHHYDAIGVHNQVIFYNLVSEYIPQHLKAIWIQMPIKEYNDRVSFLRTLVNHRDFVDILTNSGEIQASELKSLYSAHLTRQPASLSDILSAEHWSPGDILDLFKTAVDTAKPMDTNILAQYIADAAPRINFFMRSLNLLSTNRVKLNFNMPALEN